METKESTKGLFVKWGIYIVLLIVWLKYKEKLGFYYTDKATYWCVIILFLYWLFLNVMNTWRYQSPMFICNGIWGSMADPPEYVGDWAIVGLGGVLNDEFHFRGKLGACVVPRKSVQKFGSCYVSNVRPESVPLFALPDDVQNTVVTKYYNEGNVFCGYTSEPYQMTHPNVKALENHIVVLEQRNQELNDILKDKFDVIEKAAGFAGRMADHANKKNLFQKLGNFIKDDEEK